MGDFNDLENTMNSLPVWVRLVVVSSIFEIGCTTHEFANSYPEIFDFIFAPWNDSMKCLCSASLPCHTCLQVRVGNLKVHLGDLPSDELPVFAKSLIVLAVLVVLLGALGQFLEWLYLTEQHSPP